MKHCMERFAKIRLVAMDVDGTLTDGKIYVGPQGEVMKAFHVRDGYRLAQCPQRGIITAIITGRASEIVTYRSRELHISEVYQGVGDKRPVLDELMERYQCAPEEVLYIGDDCNDLTCMEVCGISACPSAAHPAVRRQADYVCAARGGEGAGGEVLGLLFGARKAAAPAATWHDPGGTRTPRSSSISWPGTTSRPPSLW